MLREEVGLGVGVKVLLGEGKRRANADHALIHAQPPDLQEGLANAHVLDQDEDQARGQDTRERSVTGGQGQDRSRGQGQGRTQGQGQGEGGGVHHRALLPTEAIDIGKTGKANVVIKEIRIATKRREEKIKRTKKFVRYYCAVLKVSALPQRAEKGSVTSQWGKYGIISETRWVFGTCCIITYRT